MKTLKLSEKDIKQAAMLLRKGENVAFPTETVYGLGADASNEKAVQKIFKAKNRPANRPLSVLVNNKKALNKYGKNISVEAEKLAKKFWPGPLTIVVEKSNYFAPSVTMGKNTIGLRMPNHPIALKIIEISQKPLATPSANSSGRPSPTSAEHVLDDLEGKIAAVLDGGETSFGIESTVIDLSNPQKPTILRPGEISKEQIEKAIEKEVYTVAEKKDKHYTPMVPVFCVSSPWIEAIQKMKDKQEKIGVLANDEIINQFANEVNASYSLGALNDAQMAKNNFYKGLRALEKENITVILAEVLKNDSSAIIYMNRLKKAANNRFI